MYPAFLSEPQDSRMDPNSQVPTKSLVRSGLVRQALHEKVSELTCDTGFFCSLEYVERSPNYAFFFLVTRRVTKTFTTDVQVHVLTWPSDKYAMLYYSFVIAMRCTSTTWVTFVTYRDRARKIYRGRPTSTQWSAWIIRGGQGSHQHPCLAILRVSMLIIVMTHD